MFYAFVAHSQNQIIEFRVGYRLNSSIIESEFSENAVVIQKLNEYIAQLNSTDSVSLASVQFGGFASPEGPTSTNLRLARERMSALEKLVRSQIQIPDSLITYNPSYISWDQFEAYISGSDHSYKQEVLDVIETSQGNDRIKKLQELQGGQIWDQLKTVLFGDMRSAIVIFTTQAKPAAKEEEPEPVVPEPVEKVEDPLPEPIVEIATPIAEAATEEESWMRRLHLKTNLIGAGLAMANLAAEIDLSEHWSLSVPVYYSTWNYFKQTVKFRTFAIQPEIRYWLSEDNSGLFAAAHCGFAYYNFATGGEYRYQDHSRETPAVGGGLNLGYRLPISRSGRMQLEFSLGGGVHHLRYDIFYNTPDTKDGLMVGSESKTYWGLDNAAVTLLYSIDLGKKGGRR